MLRRDRRQNQGRIRWKRLSFQEAKFKICFIIAICKAPILLLPLSRSQDTDGEISVVIANRKKGLEELDYLLYRILWTPSQGREKKSC